MTLVVGSLLGFAWRFVDGVATSVSTHPARELTQVSSPIISARHFPQTLSDDVRINSVRRRLVGVANALPESSCLSVNVEGKLLVDVNPTVSLVPASNMKLVVAYAALKTLGADYTFNTSARATLDGSTVLGDLFIVGGGESRTLSTRLRLVESRPSRDRSWVMSPGTTLSVIPRTLDLAFGVPRLAHSEH